MKIAHVLTFGFWPLAGYGAGLVVVPLLGAGVGAIHGAATAPHPEEVRRVEVFLHAWATTSEIQEVVRDYVLQRLRQSQPFPSVFIDGKELFVDTRADGARARHDADVALELDVRRIEISGPWATNPDGPVVITARARLVRVSDGAVLSRRRWRHPSSNVFWAWPDVEQGREGFERAMTGALAAFAEQIVADLFGESAPGLEPVGFEPAL